MALQLIQFLERLVIYMTKLDKDIVDYLSNNPTALTIVKDMMKAVPVMSQEGFCNICQMYDGKHNKNCPKYSGIR